MLVRGERIGLMGFSSRAENIMLCLSALGSVLNEVGYTTDTGQALSSAAQALGR